MGRPDYTRIIAAHGKLPKGLGAPQHEDLSLLVEEQAKEIADLKAKIAKLEQGKTAPKAPKDGKGGKKAADIQPEAKPEE